MKDRPNISITPVGQVSSITTTTKSAQSSSALKYTSDPKADLANLMTASSYMMKQSGYPSSSKSVPSAKHNIASNKGLTVTPLPPKPTSSYTKAQSNSGISVKPVSSTKDKMPRAHAHTMLSAATLFSKNNTTISDIPKTVPVPISTISPAKTLQEKLAEKKKQLLQSLKSGLPSSITVVPKTPTDLSSSGQVCKFLNRIIFRSTPPKCIREI